MLRVLFLDFDGVLHPAGAGTVKFNCLPLLEIFLREPAHTDLRVVISSTWRVAYSLAQLRRHFSVDLHSRLIGCTPELEEHHTNYYRNEEIEAWLEDNATDVWLALDDDVDGFPPRNLARLVLTDARIGLTHANLAVLRERLAV